MPSKSQSSVSWGPNDVEGVSVQEAWSSAVRILLAHGGSIRNLVVRIVDVTQFDVEVDEKYRSLCSHLGILQPKHVAYTIFPKHIAQGAQRDVLFHKYNKSGGFYDRVRTSWGTYFRRMTHYETRSGTVNQLGKIIDAIRKDRTYKRVRTSCYTMITQMPGTETTRHIGGPCLNYIALQLERGARPSIGMLAVYRNHDFLKKAYGNYLGLCHLLAFVCSETSCDPGPLTCISSRAYASQLRALGRLVGEYPHGD